MQIYLAISYLVGMKDRGFDLRRYPRTLDFRL